MRVGYSLFAVFLVAANALGQDGARPVGMVLMPLGDVTVTRGSARQPAQLADLLFAGDQIVTGANSSVMFSFCPANEKLSIAAGSAITLEAATARQTRGAAATRAAGARCALPQVALGKRDIEHIGTMAARGAPPIAIYIGGVVSSGRPLFTWRPVPNATDYTVTVRNTANRVLWNWQQAGEAREVRMPATENELPPGVYNWEVTARAATRIVGQQRAAFTVKPDAQLASMQPQDLASRIEYAVELENAGYLAEAAGVYRQLRTEVPGDSRFGSQLIWLYWNAGLIMASNEEIAAAK